jgi:hypothetical protein
MSQGIGRISGSLLKDNLLRNGVDLSFETDLLYLNVNDDRIGIQTSSPARLLEIEGSTKTTDIIVDNYIKVTSNIIFDTVSNITTDLGILYLNSNATVNAPGLSTDKILINNNKISVTTTDTDLNLTPAATKKIIINSDLDVDANLHSTGNITLGGTITLGSDSTDQVLISSDVASNIIPDLDNTYDLGSDIAPTPKRWGEVSIKDITANNVYTRNITAGGLNLTYNFSNTLFVSTNGDDLLNRGNIFVSPYRTLTKALSEASSGDTIKIMPGTYQEIFPLTVPEGVSIIGENLRSVTIVPTLATKNNNAFLLNGQSTVSNLTVANFYSPGHAFSFASGMNVTSRSPYVQNVSVITQGSVTTVDDPRGFNQGDAGKGALVDGSVVSATSNEASMLFHSVTFITPGVNALTVTNGSRVEWLSGFTYFANNGIYATQGTLGFAGQGVKFGAEIRSIASANVYGKNGVVADGADVLIYLINHNFGYVGTDEFKDNDQTQVIQENEVIELNSGKIYYSSQSQNGDFRIGNSFYVDFTKGNVEFPNSNVIFDDLSTILFEGTGENRLILKSGSIEIGDIRISDNTITTLSSDFNFVSSSGEINLLENTFLNGNIGITGNFQTDGTISFGNQSSDTITFNTELEQNLDPKNNNLYNIGSDLKRWQDIWSVSLAVTDIKFSSNIIETTVTNSNMNIDSNGTGSIKLEELLFKNSNIRSLSSADIIFAPASTKSLIINKTNAVKIPSNTVTLGLTGQLKLESTSGYFQGFSSDLVNLGGVYSKDRNTRFFAHPTDNTFRFVANNSETAQLSATGLTAILLNFGDITINNNLIQSSSTLSFSSGSVNASSLTFSGGSIAAPQNSTLTLVTGGTGYVEFSGSSAIQIPSGTRNQTPENPVVGMTRFNIEDLQVEAYNGTVWVPAGGVASEVVTQEYVEEQITFWSLIVG